MGLDVGEVEPPPCPPELAYLLHWFVELSNQRRPAFSGVGPLAWADIAAWAGVTGRRLTRFEIRVLTLLDTLYRSAAAKAETRRQAKARR